jgi:hypothetical protein
MSSREGVPMLSLDDRGGGDTYWRWRGVLRRQKVGGPVVGCKPCMAFWLAVIVAGTFGLYAAAHRKSE